MRLPGFFLAVFLAVAGVAAAGDDIQAVTTLWNAFVHSLSRGDYRQAHSLFSPESRQALQFGDFVMEYSPVSVAREMVLAKPENLSTNLDGDWAELTYGGFRPGSGRQFAVAVSMVKNGNEWGLVAARNERQERMEANARTLLRMAAGLRGLPNASQLIAGMLARESGNPALAQYRFDADGEVLKAVPSIPGLRPFHVGADGIVRPGLTPPPVPAAPPPVPEPSPAVPPPVMVDGLPELGEPPMLPPGVGVGETLPEITPPPPMFDQPIGMDRLPDPDAFSLPDEVR